jgi:hypothetical protein
MGTPVSFAICSDWMLSGAYFVSKGPTRGNFEPNGASCTVRRALFVHLPGPLWRLSGDCERHQT